MTVQEILLPVFVQVALTFVLTIAMGRSRLSALGRRDVRPKDIALGEPNWPPRTLQISNAYHNQFELPVLFYALVAIALITQKADLLFVGLSWIFVLSRIIHAGIHTTSNHLRLRFSAFVFGMLVLIVMWIVFAAKILLA